MSAVVVDTSSWISYFAGRGEAEAQAIDEALREGRVHLPPIVAAELLSGKLRPAQRTELMDFLADLPLCGTDLGHWFRVGLLREQLARKGLSLSTPDAHVVQCCLDLGGELFSEDAVFQRVSRAAPLRLAARPRATRG